MNLLKKNAFKIGDIIIVNGIKHMIIEVNNTPFLGTSYEVISDIESTSIISKLTKIRHNKDIKLVQSSTHENLFKLNKNFLVNYDNKIVSGSNILHEAFFILSIPNIDINIKVNTKNNSKEYDKRSSYMANSTTDQDYISPTRRFQSELVIDLNGEVSTIVFTEN